MKKEEIILNKVLDYSHDRAIEALKVAKKQERDKLKNGYAYVECEDGAIRLKKVKDA